MVAIRRQETEIDVSLDEIDVKPAASVRATLNPDALADYTEADQGGAKFPPADVYQYWGGGRNVYLLADGRHRYEARKANGRETISCRVHRCESKSEAERRAYAHAVGANADHGLRRSNPDKRAAVATALARPENEDARDREIARLCHVNHMLVRMVREEMSQAGKLAGKAHASTRGYKQDATLRGGTVTDGNGNMVPVAGVSSGGSSATVLADSYSGRTATPVPESVTDELGRPVPDHLQEVFAARTRFRSFTHRLGVMVTELKALASEPCGAGLEANRNQVEIEADHLKGTVSVAMPYCICPGGYRGKPCGPDCGFCSGRGWLTRMRFEQIPLDRKQHAKSFGVAAT